VTSAGVIGVASIGTWLIWLVFICRFVTALLYSEPVRVSQPTSAVRSSHAFSYGTMLLSSWLGWPVAG
jgi:hypothetical protein